MSEAPETLLLHTASTSQWIDDAALRTELEERLSDVPLRIARTPAESRDSIETAEVVVATHVSRDLLDAGPNLRWIQALSSGVEFFDFEDLRDRGIILTNAAGINAEPIAQQVFGYVLAFERRILDGIRNQQRGVWERYRGRELTGKTLGVVGLGAIGSRTAELADAFGLRVVGTKRDPTSAPDVVDEAYGPEGLYDVLVESDYVVLSCPLNEETRGLLGPEELGCMKESAVLVNVSRGPVVDEPALVEALKQGVIRGAGLDVFETEPLDDDSPLWNLSNVIVTPHMAGSSPLKVPRAVEVFAENYAAYRAGDEASMPTRIV